MYFVYVDFVDFVCVGEVCVEDYEVLVCCCVVIG